jgi:hypothetical protein
VVNTTPPSTIAMMRFAVRVAMLGSPVPEIAAPPALLAASGAGGLAFYISPRSLRIVLNCSFCASRKSPKSSGPW